MINDIQTYMNATCLLLIVVHKVVNWKLKVNRAKIAEIISTNALDLFGIWEKWYRHRGSKKYTIVTRKGTQDTDTYT